MNEAADHIQEAPRSESTVTREYTPVPTSPNYGVFDGGDTSIPVRYVLGLGFFMQSGTRDGLGFSKA